MLIESSAEFRQKLAVMGLSQQAVNAVWPSWWSEDAEVSASAQAELRFAVARKLGLEPTSLFDQEAPNFLWAHDAKFKGLNVYTGIQQAAISSFGTAFGQLLLSATPEMTGMPLVGMNAKDIRRSLLAGRPFVGLTDLCSLCWSLGIPVVHLRVFPLAAKRMAAMSVRAGERYAILIGKDASYPASTAYHLAHEIGHIALNHLQETNAIVDVEEPLEDAERDKEEVEADSFALTVLTGSPEPKIEMNEPARNGRELAHAVSRSAVERQIEPGTLSLCYGHQTGDWAVAQASLRHIYDNRHEVWKFINQTATGQLEWDELSEENRAYVRAVLGAAHLA
jgi:Zn-dependent peptidase ImmA (M78 family)